MLIYKLYLLLFHLFNVIISDRIDSNGVILGPGVERNVEFRLVNDGEFNSANNILLNNPIESHSKSSQRINDGNVHTIQFPNHHEVDSRFYRYYGISLEGVYRLEEIKIFFGLSSRYYSSRPFDIYIGWDVNLCHEKENYLDYRLVARNVKNNYYHEVQTFKLNQSDIWDLQMKARYIILASGDPYEFRKEANDFVLAEITANGTFLENYKHEEISDEKLMKSLPIYLKWHQDAFVNVRTLINNRALDLLQTSSPNENMTKFDLNPEYGFITPIDFYHLCLMAVNKNCVVIIGVHRGLYKFAVAIGTSIFPTRVEKNHSKFGNLALYGILSWLCPDCTSPRLIRRVQKHKNKVIYLTNWKESPEEILNVLTETPILVHIENLKTATHTQLELLSHLKIDYITDDEDSWDEVDTRFDIRHMDLSQLPTSVRTIRKIIIDPIEHWTIPLVFGKNSFTGRFGQYLIGSTKAQQMMQKKIKEITEFSKYFGPCRCKPLKRGPKRDILNTMKEVITHVLSDNSIKIPGSSYFPGIVRPHARSMNNVILNVDIIDANRRIYLGYGLSANKAWSYEVLSGHPNLWQIQIGCTSDEIDHKEYIQRWSKITDQYQLKRKQKKSFHPFGGLLYLIYNGESTLHGHLQIKLNGVYKAAVFNRRLYNAEEIWDRSKMETDFPWVELEGDTHNHCVQMEYAYKSTGKELAATTRTFDNWVKINHYFVGSDWRKAHSEVAVFDVEISRGYGHSGYPWMCEADWFRFVSNPENLKKQEGAWGFCHELGHNFEKDYWLISGSEESFNNLFCLVDYNYTQTMRVFTPGTVKFSRNLIESLIRQWKKPKWPLARDDLLTYYNYLGWKFSSGLLGNVLYKMRLDFESNLYEEFSVDERWIISLSKESGLDFGPFHMLMGWPISDSIKAMFKDYVCWLPSDHYTRRVSRRIKEIQLSFNKTCKGIERDIAPYFKYDQDNDYTRRYSYVRTV